MENSEHFVIPEWQSPYVTSMLETMSQVWMIMSGWPWQDILAYKLALARSCDVAIIATTLSVLAWLYLYDVLALKIGQLRELNLKEKMIGVFKRLLLLVFILSLVFLWLLGYAPFGVTWAAVAVMCTQLSGEKLTTCLGCELCDKPTAQLQSRPTRATRDTDPSRSQLMVGIKYGGKIHVYGQCVRVGDGKHKGSTVERILVPMHVLAEAEKMRKKGLKPLLWNGYQSVVYSKEMIDERVFNFSPDTAMIVLPVGTLCPLKVKAAKVAPCNNKEMLCSLKMSGVYEKDPEHREFHMCMQVKCKAWAEHYLLIDDGPDAGWSGGGIFNRNQLVGVHHSGVANKAAMGRQAYPVVAYHDYLLEKHSVVLQSLQSSPDMITKEIMSENRLDFVERLGDDIIIREKSGRIRIFDLYDFSERGLVKDLDAKYAFGMYDDWEDSHTDHISQSDWDERRRISDWEKDVEDDFDDSHYPDYQQPELHVGAKLTLKGVTNRKKIGKSNKVAKQAEDQKPAELQARPVEPVDVQNLLRARADMDQVRQLQSEAAKIASLNQAAIFKNREDQEVCMELVSNGIQVDKTISILGEVAQNVSDVVQAQAELSQQEVAARRRAAKGRKKAEKPSPSHEIMIELERLQDLAKMVMEDARNIPVRELSDEDETEAKEEKVSLQVSSSLENYFARHGVVSKFKEIDLNLGSPSNGGLSDKQSSSLMKQKAPQPCAEPQIMSKKPLETQKDTSTPRKGTVRSKTALNGTKPGASLLQSVNLQAMERDSELLNSLKESILASKAISLPKGYVLTKATRKNLRTFKNSLDSLTNI